ncbi:MAG: hypothetical protein WCD11_02445 [Solirubrobacteraceae bacterium]
MWLTPQSAGIHRPAAVTFVTTEHFTLQGARSATIAESTGRATMFLSCVSGGLIALGLIATAGRVRNAFYGFGLILLPTPSPPALQVLLRSGEPRSRCSFSISGGAHRLPRDGGSRRLLLP